MSRDFVFALRMSANERRLLRMVAVHFDRTESDMIRWLIQQVAEHHKITMDQRQQAEGEGRNNE